MVEGHVPKGVEVQVLSSALNAEKFPVVAGIFVLVRYGREENSTYSTNSVTPISTKPEVDSV
jgi:hypothetical protein